MWLCALLFVFIACFITPIYPRVWHSEHSLNHIVQDARNGRLYVGATDRLYSLSPELDQLSEVTTGPHLDNTQCVRQSSEPKCGVNNMIIKTSTSNVNKILTIDTSRNQLITCGSLFQGICQLRRLDDIDDVSHHPDDMIAANDPRLNSTVGFIAPGPPNNDNVLYVASSYVPDAKSIRTEVPPVSSRKLSGDGTLALAYYLGISDSGTKLQPFSSNSFAVSYMAGFAVDGYSYLLAVQPIDTNSKILTSKLIQICQADKMYASYVEIPITCGGSNGGGLAQTAQVFTAGHDLRVPGVGLLSRGSSVVIATFFQVLSSRSSVCLYPLTEIRTRFKENVKRCVDGVGNLGDHFHKKHCTAKESFKVTDDYCGDTTGNPNYPLSGQLPLEAQPIFTFDDTKLTAVAATAVLQRHTVAFLGTSTGRLMRILLDVSKGDARQGFTQETVIKAGEPVLPDMILTRDMAHLLVMTTNHLVKLSVEDCDSYDTCGECRKDPYCGWCTLQNRCTTMDNCQQADKELRWLTYHSTACISMSHSPLNASIWQQQMITLTVKYLPPLTLGETYSCVFDTKPVPAHVVSNNQLHCLAPERIALPATETAKDYVHITLKLRSSETGVSFMRTNLKFFDCRKHHSCSSCMNAVWECHWCIHDNKCTADVSSCHGDSVVINSYGNCPRLQQRREQILLPVEVAKQIDLTASHLPEPMGNQKGYECLVYLTNSPIHVPATRLSSTTVRCNKHQYGYTSLTESNKTVSIEVVWNEDYDIDNEYQLKATVYKCSVLGTDCSMCVSLSERAETRKYECAWCEGGHCSYQTMCAGGHTRNCAPPVITHVSPRTGPIEGGTRVTIRGSNLGRSYAQIVQSVIIAGRRCVPIKALYRVSQEIVCVTGSVTSPKEGSVTIQIDGDQERKWHGTFKYQDPVIHSLQPSLGPISGGTRVILRGENLDTGGLIQVHLDTHATCFVVDIFADMLVCQTRSVMSPINASAIYVLFEGVRRNVDGSYYQFIPDPNITGISPLSSFPSGGRLLTVKGEYFHGIQHPQMFITHDLFMSNATNCTVLDHNTMRCPSPAIKLTRRRRRRRHLVKRATLTTSQVDIGFIMDGVESVQNLSENFRAIGMLTIQPDPVYDQFDNFKRVYLGESLHLNGTNLNGACTVSEVRVTIGDAVCTVNSLDPSNLYCTPPAEQPADDRTYRVGNLPLVRVEVGNLRYELGELEYRLTAETDNEIWVIAIGVVGGFLILVIVVILIIYKRNSSQAVLRFKKMQIQLDTLESNVRIECKQAFAELQTEVSDFTSDLDVKGIPFWDYKTYTFRVLFPSLPDHPILHKKQQGQAPTFGSYDQGLQQFNQLLNSKQFLVIFIHTLEQQKNFNIRDKSLVASMLMVVLQDKMEYATEILKCLLNELIDRSVEKKHPKLMLRRNESVVEKFLANWMSLCMFDHIKRHTGSALFMLYKAIKHQTEKGPVDVITAEARYSLSEDRLLRQKIDFNVINLRVTTDPMREAITCKVLDCDTVTQVKEKVLDAIYMNTPFSQRPAIHDIDLEWRSGKSGHLPLQDEDVITEVIRKHKRINTLAHYHVPDHAEIALVMKANRNEMVHKVHGMLQISSGTGCSSINPIVTVEEGTRVWHLVKPDDHNASRGPKVISEIFLTRLLATKGTLQQFIDDLLLSITRVDYTLAPAIKHLFDFLDDAARRHNIVDQDVVHTWKSNSLPLRFWVNIIKNPEFVFDVHKSHIVDSCLSVIAQTFMDSCSTVEHRLGKDSPSNKLLFAKDISRYRHWVSKFYKNVQEMPPVSDQEINTTMMELSMNNRVDFNVSVALKELYKYAVQYHFELLEALDDEPSAKKLRLSVKFEQIAANIDSSKLC